VATVSLKLAWVAPFGVSKVGEGLCGEATKKRGTGLLVG
jgi:hypothetical protein